MNVYNEHERTGKRKLQFPGLYEGAATRAEQSTRAMSFGIEKFFSQIMKDSKGMLSTAISGESISPAKEKVDASGNNNAHTGKDVDEDGEGFGCVVCMCACVYVCVYVCIYVCMYVYLLVSLLVFHVYIQTVKHPLSILKTAVWMISRNSATGVCVRSMLI